MQNDLHTFYRLLLDAARELPREYFQLPVAGLEDPVYRERVYCYELYHHMRARWPAEFPYSLSGEVDKRGHPLIRGDSLDYVKPDFIVHVAGAMDRNLAVVEVKSASPRDEEVLKDLQKLSAFCARAGYFRGAYLFYGAAEDWHPKHQCLAVAAAGVDILLDRLDLIWHNAPGVPPERLNW